MLTVRYDRLGLRPGDRLLDLGCGFGRHAFEAARRGARVVALDYAEAELKEVRNTFGGHGRRRRGRRRRRCAGTVQGDATRLPFADATFDRDHRLGGARAHPRRRGRHAPSWPACCGPGGTMAVTVPRWLPEQVCWALSDEYHAPFVRRRPRAHLPRAASCAAKLRRRRRRARRLATTPTRCTRRTGGCAAPSARPTTTTRSCSAYRRVLEWDIVAAPPVTRSADRLLNPVLGKSLVVYATKPARSSS